MFASLLISSFRDIATYPGEATTTYSDTASWIGIGSIGSSTSSMPVTQTLSFQIVAPLQGWTYHIVMEATPAYSGNTAFSSLDVTALGAVLPTSPSNLVATLTSPTNVFLHWNDNSDNESGFDIYRSTDPTFASNVMKVTTTGTDVNEYTDTLPDETTTFYYAVYAVSSVASAADAAAGNNELVGSELSLGESVGNADSNPISGIALQSAQFGGFRLTSNNGKVNSHQQVLRDIGAQSAYGHGPSDATTAQWYDANEDGTIDGNSTSTSAVYTDGTIDGNNEHTWPISYERSIGNGWQFMTAAPSITFAGAMTGSWHIQGSTGITGFQGHGITFVPTVLTQNGRSLSATVVTNYPLPATIESETLTIHWQITFDNGKTWYQVPSGTTANHLFVTGGSAPSAYETVLWLACNGQPVGKAPHDPGDNNTPTVRYPDGAATDKDRSVVDAVWSNFSGNSTQRVDRSNLQNLANEQIMQYNHSGGSTGGSNVRTAAALLGNTGGLNGTGLGECDAWADLLVQALSADGVIASSKKINPGAGFSGFEVRAMPAQGTGGANYMAAGVTTPFNYHVVVYVPAYTNRIYDPSYGDYVSTNAAVVGNSAIALEIAYEDANVTNNTLFTAANGLQLFPHIKGKRQLRWPSLP